MRTFLWSLVVTKTKTKQVPLYVREVLKVCIWFVDILMKVNMMVIIHRIFFF